MKITCSFVSMLILMIIIMFISVITANAIQINPVIFSIIATTVISVIGFFLYRSYQTNDELIKSVNQLNIILAKLGEKIDNMKENNDSFVKDAKEKFSKNDKEHSEIWEELHKISKK